MYSSSGPSVVSGIKSGLKEAGTWKEFWLCHTLWKIGHATDLQPPHMQKAVRASMCVEFSALSFSDIVKSNESTLRCTKVLC